MQQIIWAPPRSLHQSYNFCLWKIIFLAISCIAERFVLASIFYRNAKIELHVRLWSRVVWWFQCGQAAQIGVNDCALSSPVRWWCVKVMQAVQELDYNIWVYPPVSIMCPRSGWFYAPSTHFDVVHCADHELHQFDQFSWFGVDLVLLLFGDLVKSDKSCERNIKMFMAGKYDDGEDCLQCIPLTGEVHPKRL